MTTLTTTADLEARAAWSIITEPSDAPAGTITAAIGHTAALAALTGSTDSDLAVLLVEHEAVTTVADGIAAARRWRPRTSTADVDAAIARATRDGIHLIDPSTVPGLSDLGNVAPHLLWVRGDAAALTTPLVDKIALVGARAATSYGEHVAMEFASALATREITITSGAAYGIDGAAHRGALAAGGATIAWLAGGVDRPYPMGNSDLIARITRQEGSAIVSEVAPGATPTKWRFLSRNRLLAATAAATVVIEAGWRSGSLNTAGHAAALGRTLGAVPGPITSPASAGCHRLLREFDAQVIGDVDDAYALLGR